ncbi:MAG: hypothetical protein CVU70_00255 [Deltaproteobacteria bacterium HGW-Deltaproteobacteria-5]|nr:MAG: hypothetical protein CVU70_00255 [Deltaproteobacteria bacterium HGW-Deltaproteobacteria-5]
MAVEHSDQDRVGEEAAVEQSDEDRGDDQDRRDVQILEKLLTQTLLLKWQKGLRGFQGNIKQQEWNGIIIFKRILHG